MIDNLERVRLEDIGPAAEAVKAYLCAHRGLDYLEFVDAIVTDLTEYAQNNSSEPDWEDPLPEPTEADMVIPIIEDVGIRCRLELMNSGGGKGLRALIENAEGHIDGEHPELTKVMRIGITPMLVGSWRVAEAHDGYLTLHGPMVATITVRLSAFASPGVNLLRAIGVQV